MLAVAHGVQHLDGGHYAALVVALYAEPAAGMGAYGEVNGVELAAYLVEGEVGAYGGVFDFDAEREDDVDVVVEVRVGQAVAGDAVAQHAAELLVLFKYGDGVAHEREEVGRG